MSIPGTGPPNKGGFLCGGITGGAKRQYNQVKRAKGLRHLEKPHEGQWYYY